MIPRTREYPAAYIIEFKTADAQQKRDVPSDALAQIGNKEYEAALANAGVPHERIKRLGIVLQGKRIEVQTGGIVG